MVKQLASIYCYFVTVNQLTLTPLLMITFFFFFKQVGICMHTYPKTRESLQRHFFSTRSVDSLCLQKCGSTARAPKATHAHSCAHTCAPSTEARLENAFRSPKPVDDEA